MRFVNASGGYAALDAWVDDKKRFASVVYGQTASYADIDPQNAETTITRADSTTPLLTLTPQLKKDLHYTLLAYGGEGALKTVLLDESADPCHPSAVRASMGALFWHPVVQASFTEFAAWSREHGYHVYGSSAHGSLDYRQIGHFKRPMLLLLGSEREGSILRANRPLPACVAAAHARAPLVFEFSSRRRDPAVRDAVRCIIR